jgi:hypothetical protein
MISTARTGRAEWRVVHRLCVANKLFNVVSAKRVWLLALCAELALHTVMQAHVIACIYVLHPCTSTHSHCTTDATHACIDTTLPQEVNWGAVEVCF